MGQLWKIGLAALVGAAVAVPATVIARGFDTGGLADRFLPGVTGKVTTQGKGYKPVDGLDLPESPEALAVTVSAQMTEGKAKFRVVSSTGDPAPPGPVLFSKGAESFTFAATAEDDACPAPEVQWRRVGDKPAVAAKVATLSVWEDQPCP